MSTFWKLLEEHGGKILGFTVGIILGVVYLLNGLWDTFIFLVIVSAGVYLGRKVDKRESLAEILDRILPGKFTNK